MEAVIEQSIKDKRGLELTVNAHNTLAISLYSRLGFVTKTAVTTMRGINIDKNLMKIYASMQTESQSSHCRKMEEKDVERCKKYCIENGGLPLTFQLKFNARAIVCYDKDEKNLLGYSLGFQPSCHTLVNDDCIFFSLLSFFCESFPSENPHFFVSLSHHSSLLNKCILVGFKMIKNSFWMTRGENLEMPTKTIFLPAI